MIRSFDPKVFEEAVKPYPNVFKTENFDFKGWLEDLNNIMYEEDGSVGLCCWEYPGVYTVHWFYKVRGKEALNLARKMIKDLFEDKNVKTLRGLTEVSLKPARWAARQLGFKSYGVETFPQGDYEILILTKKDFYERNN